jgi:hypothetical protein
MSKIALTPSATGTGVFTISSPATNTNRTLTLPDEAGTVLTTATAGVPVNGPAFSAYRGGTEQSVTSNVSTKIQFNTEEFDTNSCFDSTTNYRFTPTVAGYYLISGAMTSAGTTITQSVISVYKNGSEYKRLQYSTNNTQTSGAVIVYLNGATDYIEFYGAIVAASAAAFYNGQTYTYATGALIRSAV